MFLRNQTKPSIGVSSVQIDRLKEGIKNADAVVIGAGAGLSTSAGFTYSGERFDAHFRDFRESICPQEIAQQSICINADIGAVLSIVLKGTSP